MSTLAWGVVLALLAFAVYVAYHRQEWPKVDAYYRSLKGDLFTDPPPVINRATGLPAVIN